MSNYKFKHTNGEGLPNYPSKAPKLANITVYMHDSLLVATHNMPCCVCRTKRAVYLTTSSVFVPCYDCQKKGYKLAFKKKESWLSRIIKFIRGNK